MSALKQMDRTALRRVWAALRSKRWSPAMIAAWLALVISLAGGWAAYRVAVDVFDAMPHLEDELAYTWQARVIASGRLALPSPEYPREFLVPFVVDYQGLRFGKYPLGWPVVLALGVVFGVRTLVNPVLAALGVWFSFRLGQRLFGNAVGVLVALLTATSPFFLLNSGSLLSHPLGLLLSVAFALFWFDVVDGGGQGKITGRRAWLAVSGAGAALGALALTRPFTAVAVALPFGVYGIYRLVTGPADIRRRIVGVGLIAGAIALLHFAWQWAVTGDPFLNPYELWWPYDKIGFGAGVGVTEKGHTLEQAWLNTKFSLAVGYMDLFGWLRFSYLFLPFGIWAIAKAIPRRENRALAVQAAIPFFSLAAAYMAYWIGSWLFGPRYFYEGLFSLTLLTGIGIAWLAGWPLQSGSVWPQYTGWQKARPLGVFALVLVLFAGNLIFYLPTRFESMQQLYNISAERAAPFKHPDFLRMAPAVIVVKADHWTDYGTFLDMQDPDVQSPANDEPFVFVFGGNPLLFEELDRLFPSRAVYRYDPDTPRLLYRFP